MSEELLALVEAAHQRSARRNNLSTAAVLSAWAGSRDYTKAIAAALMTLGEVHGPIPQTVRLLADPEPVKRAEAYIEAGLKVPGWGSSFHKGKDDPDWDAVRAWLQANAADLWATVEQITAKLAHKNVRPNPSCYTACAAIVAGIPADLAPCIFVDARLPVWTRMLLEHP